MGNEQSSSGRHERQRRRDEEQSDIGTSTIFKTAVFTTLAIGTAAYALYNLSDNEKNQDSQFDFKPDESNINLRMVEENQQMEDKNSEQIQVVNSQNSQVHLRLTQVDSYDKISIEGDNEEVSSPCDNENVNTNAKTNTPPDAFLCPITFDLMEEPVFLVETGHSFERYALEEWLQNNNTCPLTQTELKTKQFVTNWSLKKAIEEWKQQK
eukprot:gene3160-5476_t